MKRRLRWPVINLDLSRPAHRWKLLGAAGVLLLMLVGIGFAGVQGYGYTESAGFCGTVCHSMDPQWVRYQASPHANVRCADCHIGPGADFFVRSKIDGLRQVVAETLNTYHRPILSPIHNLRPARETCEECHSPTTFKDNIVKIKQHFDNDRSSTPIQTTLILKMGGQEETTGRSKGIHWHISGKVYYIARDAQRQDIAWVGVEQADGSLREYFKRDILPQDQAALVEEARANGELRTMDCIDCHNRTAHYIPSPQEAVDRAIAEGTISRSLPYIRAQAVEVLSAEYASQDDAFAAIDKLIDGYAASGNLLAPSGAARNEALEAVKTIKSIYASTNFPEMRLDWKVNPNNERHTPTLGCFRCHDGNHVLAGTSGDKEQSIAVECNTCHTVPITGRGSEMLFEAPVVVGSAPASHKEYSWTTEHRSITEGEKQQCYQCHGQGFCNNGACHNLSHPADMLYTHAQEYRKTGGQVCYTCHQDMLCIRCHPDGVIKNP